MAKPVTVKLTGTFEMGDHVSLKEMHEALMAAEEQLHKYIGPGQLVLRIGRQELRA